MFEWNGRNNTQQHNYTSEQLGEFERYFGNVYYICLDRYNYSLESPYVYITYSHETPTELLKNLIALCTYYYVFLKEILETFIGFFLSRTYTIIIWRVITSTLYVTFIYVWSIQKYKTYVRKLFRMFEKYLVNFLFWFKYS